MLYIQWRELSPTLLLFTQLQYHVRVTEFFRLEKTFNIIKSQPSTATSTTKPRPSAHIYMSFWIPPGYVLTTLITLHSIIHIQGAVCPMTKEEIKQLSTCAGKQIAAFFISFIPPLFASHHNDWFERDRMQRGSGSRAVSTANTVYWIRSQPSVHTSKAPGPSLIRSLILHTFC